MVTMQVFTKNIVYFQGIPLWYCHENKKPIKRNSSEI